MWFLQEHGIIMVSLDVDKCCFYEWITKEPDDLWMKKTIYCFCCKT